MNMRHSPIGRIEKISASFQTVGAQRGSGSARVVQSLRTLNLELLTAVLSIPTYSPVLKNFVS